MARPQCRTAARTTSLSLRSARDRQDRASDQLPAAASPTRLSPRQLGGNLPQQELQRGVVAEAFFLPNFIDQLVQAVRRIPSARMPRSQLRIRHLLPRLRFLDLPTRGVAAMAGCMAPDTSVPTSLPRTSGPACPSPDSSLVRFLHRSTQLHRRHDMAPFALRPTRSLVFAFSLLLRLWQDGSADRTFRTSSLGRMILPREARRSFKDTFRVRISLDCAQSGVVSLCRRTVSIVAALHALPRSVDGCQNLIGTPAG
eukprot:scaffold923_cov256-Pinguiococcus_pyrenoidosus.AAC.38